MDSKVTLLIILLLCAVPFSFYLVRSDYIGADGYYYLSYVCQHDTPDHTALNASAVLKMVYDVLPCNELALKLLLFGILFACVVITWRIGLLFNKESLAYLWFFFAPTVLGKFMEFEDEVWAYPLLFLSYWFFFKAKLSKQKRWYGWCAATLLAAFFIWRGSGLFVLAFASSSIFFVLAAIPAVIWLWRDILAGIIPNWNVQENLPLIGFIALNLLLMGFWTIEPIMLPIILFWSILLLFNAHWVLFLVPLLAVCVDRRFQKLNEYKRTVWLCFGVMLLIGYSFAVLSFEPTPNERDAVNYALTVTNKGAISNDWGLGYYIFYRGGTPSAFGWETPLKKEGIVVTHEKIGCKLLHSFTNVFVYNCRV